MGYSIDTESETLLRSNHQPFIFNTILVLLKGVLNMSATPITQNTFKSEVLDSKLPVLVDFWAPWCGPCRMLSPVIDQIADENPGSLKVAKVNVDEENALASQFGVMSIPMLVLIKDGKVLDTSLGAKPKAAVEKWLTSHISL